MLKVNSLSIDEGGTLDLTNNLMVLDYSGNSPASTVRSYLTEGYNSGSWTGGGLTSSSAAAHVSDDYKTALGYAETSDLFTTFPATYAGQSVDNTAILVRYTWVADANLDGRVDLTDFTFLAAHFSTGTRTYTGCTATSTTTTSRT